jgi:hypothetical protein
MRRVVWLAVLLFAREAHVSGGYTECFSDLSATVCVESDVSKRFADAADARSWVGEHRTQAELRLATMVPRLRVAVQEAQRAGLSVAAVDDWRLRTDGADARRVQVDLGAVARQRITVTVTLAAAPSAAERVALQAHLARALDVPAYDPTREREGIYAPSLALSPPPPPSPSSLPSSPKPSSSKSPPPPLAPSTPSSSAPPAPPLAVEDIRPWQPLWVAEPAMSAPRLGMGTTTRVSPRAAALWRPWLDAQLAALRASWATRTCALPALRTAGDAALGGFLAAAGFRPWGPLLLDDDVQARIDDGQLTRMAHVRLARGPGDAVYGSLTDCLREAAAPLPSPPSPVP